MDKTEHVKSLLEKESKYEQMLAKAVKNKTLFHYSSSDFSRPDKGDLHDVLKQRHSQRRWLFWYSLSFSSLTFFGLCIMLVSQGIYKMHHQSDLFGKLELGSVAIGVFVQFLGLLKIITDSLWNDKPYLDSGVFKNEKDKFQ